MTPENKKIAIILISLLLVVLIVTVNRRTREVQQPMINMEKYWYAVHLSFDFRIILHSEVFSDGVLVLHHIHPGSERFDPSFNELVFVHNEAESVDFPEIVIVAWPKEVAVEGLIAGIHWAVSRQEEDLRGTGENRILRRPVVTLEEFGFTYPLTAEDLVVNWEKVNTLWQSFDNAEQTFIVGAAHHGGPRID